MKIRANYEVGTLESKVEVQINDAVKSIDTLIGSLKDLKTGLSDTIGSANNNNLKKNVDKSTKTINAIKKAMNFGVVYAGLRKGWNAIKDISSQYIDMVETNNLFEVSMGKVVDQYGNLDEVQSQYYTKALNFQNEMNEKLATNRAELQRYQAMYYSMFKSQGIGLDSSYLMSESMTKAGYDIASLYNLSVEDSMNKLKSGLAGQVESLRQIGIDVSESSLTKVLNEVGITDRSVQQLSYAEKEVARYIAIMEQAKAAQGDFAKTMDNSANQIKIFKNQIAELKQVAGAFIVNTFGNILVYVNAVIMVLKEILKSFANLFGYDLDTGGANLSSSLGVDDLNDGLGSAAKKAKELKKQLMGFDEINNIDPNRQAGGSSGGGIATGVDDKLLKALKEWDNKMDSISGKAQQIRDKMLEWLGFVRDDNGGWKLGEGLTNFEKILDIVKAIGIALLTWKVSSAVTGLLKGLGILGGMEAFKIAFGITLALTGIYLLYKGIKHLLNGDVDIFTILETALGGSLTIFGIAAILKGAIKTITLGTACKISFGITLALGGVYMEYKSVKKMLEGDISLGTILQGTGSAFLIGIGTALITGSPLVGLIATAGVLAFNLGIEIGMALKEVDWAGIWQDITKNCEIAWNAVEGFFTQAVPKWWNDNIAPWFTKEKWKSIGKNMKEGLAEKWIEFADWWENTAVVQWWNNNVAPWFTKEKWQEEATKARDGMNGKFTEWKDSFKIIEEWWNTKVSPWFTKEKWLGAANNAKSGIEDKFNEWKNNFKPIQDWVNDKVIPWFSWDRWREIANNAKTGVENKFNEWRWSFNPIRDWWSNSISPWFSWDRWRGLASNALSALSSAFSNFSFPRIKLPHFSVSYKYGTWDSAVWKALGLSGRPSLDVSWYANGGMPDMGELFVARESGPEMVGKIGNKTTVANNDQIVTAIKQGVYEAVSSAMANGSNEVKINVTADEGIIVKKASQGFKDYVMQTGELPFPIPVG